MKINKSFLLVVALVLFQTASSKASVLQCWSYLGEYLRSSPIASKNMSVKKVLDYDPRPNFGKPKKIAVYVRDIEAQLTMREARRHAYLSRFTFSNFELLPKAVAKRLASVAYADYLGHKMIVILSTADGNTLMTSLNLGMLRTNGHASIVEAIHKRKNPSKVTGLYIFFEREVNGLELPTAEDFEIVARFGVDLEKSEGHSIGVVGGVVSNLFPKVIYEFRADFEY